MKKWIPLVALLVSTSAFAGFLEENTRVLKLDAFVDSNAFDDSLIGLEAGFGVAVFDQSVLSLFLGGAKNDVDTIFRFTGVEIEEHYPLHENIIPFAGVAAGYADTEFQGGYREEGFMGRLQAGVKLRLSERWAFSATLRYWMSPDEVFIDGDSTDRYRTDVAAGLRFMY